MWSEAAARSQAILPAHNKKEHSMQAFLKIEGLKLLSLVNMSLALIFKIFMTFSKK